MDRASALRQLPAVYARALRLRDLGVDDDGVAELLDIPAESIPALFRIAEAKLLEISEPVSHGTGLEGARDRAGPREGDGQVV
jgi:hypothetical protein